MISEKGTVIELKMHFLELMFQSHPELKISVNEYFEFKKPYWIQMLTNIIDIRKKVFMNFKYNEKMDVIKNILNIDTFRMKDEFNKKINILETQNKSRLEFKPADKNLEKKIMKDNLIMENNKILINSYTFNTQNIEKVQSGSYNRKSITASKTNEKFNLPIDSFNALNNGKNSNCLRDDFVKRSFNNFIIQSKDKDLVSKNSNKINKNNLFPTSQNWEGNKKQTFETKPEQLLETENKKNKKNILNSNKIINKEKQIKNQILNNILYYEKQTIFDEEEDIEKNKNANKKLINKINFESYIETNKRNPELNYKASYSCQKPLKFSKIYNNKDNDNFGKFDKTHFKTNFKSDKLKLNKSLYQKNTFKSSTLFSPNTSHFVNSPIDNFNYFGNKKYECNKGIKKQLFPNNGFLNVDLENVNFIKSVKNIEQYFSDDLNKKIFKLNSNEITENKTPNKHQIKQKDKSFILNSNVNNHLILQENNKKFNVINKGSIRDNNISKKCSFNNQNDFEKTITQSPEKCKSYKDQDIISDENFEIPFFNAKESDYNFYKNLDFLKTKDQSNAFLKTSDSNFPLKNNKIEVKTNPLNTDIAIGLQVKKLDLNDMIFISNKKSKISNMKIDTKVLQTQKTIKKQSYITSTKSIFNDKVSTGTDNPYFQNNQISNGIQDLDNKKNINLYENKILKDNSEISSLIEIKFDYIHTYETKENPLMRKLKNNYFDYTDFEFYEINNFIRKKHSSMPNKRDFSYEKLIYLTKEHKCSNTKKKNQVTNQDIHFNLKLKALDSLTIDLNELDNQFKFLSSPKLSYKKHVLNEKFIVVESSQKDREALLTKENNNDDNYIEFDVVENKKNNEKKAPAELNPKNYKISNKKNKEKLDNGLIKHKLLKEEKRMYNSKTRLTSQELLKFELKSNSPSNRKKESNNKFQTFSSSNKYSEVNKFILPTNNKVFMKSPKFKLSNYINISIFEGKKEKENKFLNENHINSSSDKPSINSSNDNVNLNSLKININSIDWGKNSSNYYSGYDLSKKNFSILNGRKNTNLNFSNNSVLKGSFIKKEKLLRLKKDELEEIVMENYYSKNQQNKIKQSLSINNNENIKTYANSKQKFSFQNWNSFNNFERKKNFNITKNSYFNKNEESNEDKHNAYISKNHNLVNDITNVKSHDLNNSDTNTQTTQRKNIIENYNNKKNKTQGGLVYNNISRNNVKDELKNSNKFNLNNKEKNYFSQTNIDFFTKTDKFPDIFSPKRDSEVKELKMNKSNLDNSRSINEEKIRKENKPKRRFNNNLLLINSLDSLEKQNTIKDEKNLEKNQIHPNEDNYFNLSSYIGLNKIKNFQEKNISSVSNDEKTNNINKEKIYDNLTNTNSKIESSEKKMYLIDELDKITSLPGINSFSKNNLKKMICDKLLSEFINKEKLKKEDDLNTKENLQFLDVLVVEKIKDEFKKQIEATNTNFSNFLINKNFIKNLNNQNLKQNLTNYQEILENIKPRSNLTTRILMNCKAKNIFKKKDIYQ